MRLLVLATAKDTTEPFRLGSPWGGFGLGALKIEEIVWKKKCVFVQFLSSCLSHFNSKHWLVRSLLMMLDWPC